MDQRHIDLYDEYARAPLPRRVFMQRLAALAGGTPAALALLPLLASNRARAASVAEDDARITVQRLSYPGVSGPIRAYFARPRSAERCPAVLVIHENRGLNRHFEDVARRLAAEGYLALAPDALSSLGGTPADEDAARALFAKLPPAQAAADLAAGVTYLAHRADATGKVGCVGFCWGGGITNLVVVQSPELISAAVFYGMQPPAADVPKIRARLLLHYAENDARINAGIAAYEAALQSAGKDYVQYHYPGTQHAFYNDTSSARYHPDAATLAWKRTLDFFSATLRS